MCTTRKKVQKPKHYSHFQRTALALMGKALQKARATPRLLAETFSIMKYIQSIPFLSSTGVLWNMGVLTGYTSYSQCLHIWCENPADFHFARLLSYPFLALLNQCWLRVNAAQTTKELRRFCLKPFI